MVIPENGWVITLDGPAASGKSTTARRVADRLGFVYLDTGALYRALTVLALAQGIDIEDAEALERLLARVELRVQRNGTGQSVFSGTEDLTPALRTEAVERCVSALSAVPAVRAGMLDLQRAQRTQPGLVAEGRDLGTVVFPDAHLKVFLVADLETRAQRRLLERLAAGTGSDAAAEQAALRTRDDYDSRRATAPLRQANDAVLVDTTDLTVDGQVERVIELFAERTGG